MLPLLVALLVALPPGAAGGHRAEQREAEERGAGLGDHRWRRELAELKAVEVARDRDGRADTREGEGLRGGGGGEGADLVLTAASDHIRGVRIQRRSARAREFVVNLRSCLDRTTPPLEEIAPAHLEARDVERDAAVAELREAGVIRSFSYSGDSAG